MVALNNRPPGIGLAAFDQVVGVGVDLEREVPAVFFVDHSNLVQKRWSIEKAEIRTQDFRF